MQFPLRGQQIVMALYQKNMDLAKGTDDQRRALTMKICQQVRYELGEGWGTKSADRTRPPSKDSIAHFDGTTLLGWDWQNGATREPMALNQGNDITGQNFIAVMPVNHLGISDIPPIVQPPVVVPPIVVDDELKDKIDEIINMQADMMTLLVNMNATLERIGPPGKYQARIFGQTITFEPVE